MSEEYENEELSAEELFEQHQAEIEARFAEHGFFRRFVDMCTGLGKPHNTREYKVAIREFQRLKAPIIAVLGTVLGVVALIVITAVGSSGTAERRYSATLPPPEPEETQEEEQEPPEELNMQEDVDVNVEISTDIPTPQIAAPAPPSPSPGGEPDKVSAAPSPVTMSAVSGTVKMRGIGDGDGGGFGTVIGGTGGGQNIDGCLIGIICDMKKDGNGNSNGYTKDGAWDRLKSLAQAKFSNSAMSKYLVAPKKVALNKVYIPTCPAEEGPKAFGLNDAGDTGWMAFYEGDLKVAKKMRFRFVGYFDEFMVISINKKVVFEAEWLPGTPQISGNGPGRITGWKPSDQSMVGKYVSWQRSAFMVFGDWIDAEPGKPLKMQLALGETAGGACGGLLCVQVEGEEYPEVQCKFGKHLQLPVFSSRLLSKAERDRIRKQCTEELKTKWPVPPYQFKIETPSFNAKGKKGKDKSKKSDVSVDVEI